MPAGEVLLVRTVSRGPPLRLAVIEAGPRAPGPLSAALAHALPHQDAARSLAVLLRAVRIGPNAHASPALGAAIDDLSRSLPSPQTLSSPDGLAAALRASGALLEARLSGYEPEGTVRLSGDLKARLLVLREALGRPAAPPRTGAGPDLPPAPRDPASAALARGVHSALQRIVANQVLTLVHHDSGRAVWLTDLPVQGAMGAPPVEVRIARDGPRRKHAPGAAPLWRVHLRFTVPERGRLEALIALGAGGISVALWAERAAAARDFQSTLETLRTRIQRCGLEVQALACHHGHPPRGAGIDRHPADLDPLVDRHT